MMNPLDPSGAQAAGRPLQDLPLASQVRYTSILLEQMAHGFVLHAGVENERRLTDCRFLDINSAFETITGLSREQVLGQTVGALLPALADDWLAGCREVMASGRPQHFERYFETLGRYFRIVTLDLGAAEFATLLIDITEHRQVERALREESAFRQAIIEGAAEGLCVCHEVADPPFIRFTVWNPRMTEITGYTLEEINRLGWYQALFPDPVVQQHIRLRVERVRVGEQITDEEWTITRRDGRQRVLRASTSVLERSARGDIPILAIVIDITERKEMERHLAKSQENFRNVVLAHRSGVLILDQAGRVLFSNPAARSLLARRPQELENVYWGLPSALGHTAEVDIFRPDRTLGVAEMTVTPTEWEGQPAYLVMLHDVTERNQAETRIRQMAYYDGLTGLPNRLLFLNRLTQALARAKRQQQKLAVLFLDLDNFKPVNDTLGHAVGDQLLRLVAERLLTCVRDTDTVARLGGDEFIVLLEVPESPETVHQIAGRILAALARGFQVDGRELAISASIGISCYPQHGDEVDILIKQADAAMYHAKARGRNNAWFYTPALGTHIVTRLHLENRLRVALERAEFVLHYQPQVEIPSGRIIGVEALLRWQPPEQGLLAPSDFLHVLEDSALIVAVGEWVLATACAQLGAWQRAGLAPVTLAVNLSARQFDRQPILAAVGRVLEQTGLAAGRLSLEITENTLMENVETSLAVIKDLHALGVGIDVDDFGTGYSSVGYLKRFAVDRLKIDHSFVQAVTEDANAAAVTAAITAMARHLGMRVLAEGVETPAQLAVLRAQGCREMQGYLFSPPLPAQDMAGLLRQGRLSGPPWETAPG